LQQQLVWSGASIFNAVMHFSTVGGCGSPEKGKNQVGHFKSNFWH
jgi:hypothetical protein